MLVLKILAAPVMVALSLLAAMVTFLFCVASAVCELGCIVLTLLSLILFIGGQTVGELAALEQAILSGADIRADETLGKHADWVEELKTRYTFTPENTADILRREVGAVFAQVLEDAGVFKRNETGRAAFRRFLGTADQEGSL